MVGPISYTSLENNKLTGTNHSTQTSDLYQVEKNIYKRLSICSVESLKPLYWVAARPAVIKVLADS